MPVFRNDHIKFVLRRSQPFKQACSASLISSCECWPARSASKLQNVFLLRFSNPFPPLQRSKTPETPNLSKICPSDCFWGFQSGGLKIGKICQNFEKKKKKTVIFGQILNFSPPDWNPQKQSLGQILDKFGVSGVFERCKGGKGSQA